MAMTAMSRALRCASDGALRASKETAEEGKPAAVKVGTSTNMSHLTKWGGSPAMLLDGRPQVNGFTTTLVKPYPRVETTLRRLNIVRARAALNFGARPRVGKRLPDESVPRPRYTCATLDSCFVHALLLFRRAGGSQQVESSALGARAPPRIPTGGAFDHFLRRS